MKPQETDWNEVNALLTRLEVGRDVDTKRRLRTKKDFPVPGAANL